MIIIIAAIANNNELGKNNEIIWHLPDDFKRLRVSQNRYQIARTLSFHVKKTMRQRAVSSQEIWKLLLKNALKTRIFL